jgi:flagellar biosynthesis protein FliP
MLSFARTFPLRALAKVAAAAALAVVAVVAAVTMAAGAHPASAQTAPAITTPPIPAAATGADAPSVGTGTGGAGANAGATAGATAGNGAGSTAGSGKVDINVQLPGTNGPSQSIVIILVLTLLAVAPSLLIMMTSFTRIVIVLSLTRQAMGLQAVPPNQVIAGLALFLSLFVMAPTLKQVNTDALQPWLKGKITQDQAWEAAQAPIKQFMLKQTRKSELQSMINASKEAKPGKPEDVSLTTLIPAFILSELKTAFLIGFVIFVPFLVIDLVVSSSLMSMGMMMLPPSLVSLPFKLLLFVMVDGWALVVSSLLSSFK